MTEWLAENGRQGLELLLRAVLSNPSFSILVIDDDRRCYSASVGASNLFGIALSDMIGRPIDDLVDPVSRFSTMSQLWNDYLAQGKQQGSLRTKGSCQEIKYVAQGRVLPGRHILALCDAPVSESFERTESSIPLWAQDYGCVLLDDKGCISAWHSGAERVYGYCADEICGRHISFLQDAAHTGSIYAELERTQSEGFRGTQMWQERKDGSPLFANIAISALRNRQGDLQGFAYVVRDFTAYHVIDTELRLNNDPQALLVDEAIATAVVYGEFDTVLEANDPFFNLIGWRREDLAAGSLNWLDLTPAEYAAVDGHAHEEALQFGACVPYEKKLIKKDGSHVGVRVTLAILKLCPFRWMAFFQDLRDRDRYEILEDVQLEQFTEVIGRSIPLQRVLQQVEMVASTDATVLIVGETGTGKELIFRAIHRLSPRRDNPCISLNCAAIPTGLLESELFGYEKGAFTGALSQKIGRFEMANKGTLFLDEVGDIPLELQPKLLRALQEKSFERLGGTKTIPIDVRLVAATNRNLEQMMRDNLFRSDLYYRLRVFPITVPPLRDRKEDIPILVRYFTQKYAVKMNRKIDKIPTETMLALVNWPWPGNVRELENFIERAAILSQGSSLRAPLDEIRQHKSETSVTIPLDQVVRDYILRVLRESGGVVAITASRLGLHRTTLNSTMRKLGISRQDL